jgi:Fe-S cluster assembly protein SufD
VSSPASNLTERIAADYASVVATLPRSDDRRSAFEELHRVGLPGSRDENWKYANLRALERQRFVPARTTVPSGMVLPARLEGFGRYVFVDGALAPEASDHFVPNTVMRLSEAPAVGPRSHAGRDERFALLNEAFAPDGAVVQVSEGAPLRLEFLFIASAAASEGASYPHLEVQLAAGSSLDLVERHLSVADAASFVTSAVRCSVGSGATVRHCRVLELNPRSVLIDTLSANVSADAAYRLQSISTGGLSARSTLALRLDGERAALDLTLASLGDRQQVQDVYAVVEHVAPNARTRQLFRGIAAGRSRVACNGKIVVAKNAHGTDSSQSLRGLLAGTDAEIDVRPQLEIYTDDVRCAHGATAGKLDDNMLFYLLSRGLDRPSAQRLLKWAFLEDAITQIAWPALRRQVEERLMIHLQDEALRELL